MRSLQEIFKSLSGNLKIEIPSCELILMSPICSHALSPMINLIEDNEVTVMTRWDVKACKKPLYRTAVTVLLNSRRQGTPSLGAQHHC
jgi:hypothetical protein